MKTLLLLVLLPVFACAQTWAPIGAKWTYSQSTLNPNYETYSTFQSIADTFIRSHSCRVIEEVNRYYYNSPIARDHYMYSDSNRVYLLKDSNWCLLYDFNVQVGDSFAVSCYPLQAHIQSIDTVNINGINKRRFLYLAGDIDADFSGYVIESIGNSISMFPVGDNDNSSPFRLRCYEDSLIGQYKNQYGSNGVWTQSCDLILTDINDVNADGSMKLYPNPIYDILNIQASPDEKQVQIIDILGNILMDKATLLSDKFDLSAYPNGTYIVRIRNSQNESSVHRIEKISR